MEGLAIFVISLNTSNWITILFGLVGMVGVSISAANYWHTHRERKHKTYKESPALKAVINSIAYRDGWRSVHLHITPAAGNFHDFPYKDWKIDRMRLLQPRSAVLARAENDDYATGVFYPENLVRALEGKAEGRIGRYGFEFFIKFKENDDRGSKAKFKVTFSRVDGAKRRTIQIWATLPQNAELTKS